MLNIWKLLQIVFNASNLEKMGVTVVWLWEVFCEVFALVKRLITNCLMFNSSLPRFLFSLICGKEHLKDFCLVYNFNFVCYNLGGEQSRIILAERRENGRLGPLWAVCFLSAEQMPGRPASLLCQSQAIRANGSTCLYVGRVRVSVLRDWALPVSRQLENSRPWKRSLFWVWQAAWSWDADSPPPPRQGFRRFAEVEFGQYL